MVGIIGLPYAFNRAGLSSWDCIVVFTDWSCRLDDSVGKYCDEGLF